MPKYRFQCTVCECIETVFISMSETLEDCPQCGSKTSMNKLFDNFFSEVKHNKEHKVGNITKDYIEKNREILNQQIKEAQSKEYEPT